MGTTEKGPVPRVSRRRFTWRRFWIAYAVVAVLVGIPGAWMAYQEWVWPQKRRSYESQLETMIRLHKGASPERAAAILGLGEPEKVRQAEDGQYMVMRWPSPFWHYYLELTFRHGGLERGAMYEREPYPLTDGQGIEHTVVGRIYGVGRYPILMYAAVPWFLAFVTALFAKDQRKLCGHIMLASSIAWGLAGLAHDTLTWRRFNLLDPEDLAAMCRWFIPSIVSVAVLIWGYRGRPGQPFPTCQRCRYNLTGNVSGICPECGTPVPAEVRDTLAGKARPNES